MSKIKRTKSKKTGRISRSDIDVSYRGKTENEAKESRGEGRKRRFEAIYWAVKDAETRGILMRNEHKVKELSTTGFIEEIRGEVHCPDALGILAGFLEKYAQQRGASAKRYLSLADNGDVNDKALLEKLNAKS